MLEMLNKQQANGKAIGAACRHSGRSLEDCYRRNAKVAKADIFAGWKEMNEYMISKKMEIVPPPPDVTTGSLSPMAALPAEGEAPAQLTASASQASAPADESAAKKH